jgi:hypothetical protein
MSTPHLAPSYHIKLDGCPYLGEHEDTEPAPSRWAYRSPVTRNKIKVGHPLDNPISITGNINLRSHIDRILTRMGEGQRITNIEITRLA